MKVGEIQVESNPKILLYGSPGTGKTAFMLTYGEGLFVMDFDDGLLTGARLEDRFKDRRRSVEFERFVDQNPLQGRAFQRAKVFLYQLTNKLSRIKDHPDPNLPKALGVDSLTTLGDAAMRYVLGNNAQLKEGAMDPITMKYWGLAIREVDDFLQTLKSLPIPVIVVAHEGTYESDGDSQTRIAIYGKKLPDKVASYFHEIWRLRKKFLTGGKMDFVIQTQASPSTLARTRAQAKDGSSVSLGLREIIEGLGWSLSR